MPPGGGVSTVSLDAAGVRASGTFRGRLCDGSSPRSLCSSFSCLPGGWFYEPTPGEAVLSLCIRPLMKFIKARVSELV